MGRTIYLELVEGSRLATDLVAGGLWVQDSSLAMQEVCELVVFNEAGQLELTAKTVYLDGNGGVGLELTGFDTLMRAQIEDLLASGTAAAAVVAAEAPPEPAPEVPALATGAPSAPHGDSAFAESGDDAQPGEAYISEAEAIAAGVDVEHVEAPVVEHDDDAPMETHHKSEDEIQHQTLHERLRGLSLVEQIKRAKQGDVTERILLERIYGKNVWEALLRNPRLSPPEVARIARMGALPRPMIELIVGNGAWLQVPEVRRALLTNPRLGLDQIMRVLRLMAKPELKLAAIQTAYPYPVRDAAKRMLKSDGG